MNDEGTTQGVLPTTRIEALTDCVLSIAMTLLILDIHVPDLPPAQADAELPLRLLAMWPSFVGYVISFLILGVYWVGSHYQFTFIRRADRALLWINVVFLMGIAFIPYTTSLLSRYPDSRFAIVVYSASLILIGLVSYFHWRYATRGRRLVAPDLPDKVIKVVKKRILFAPFACLASIGLSLYSTRLCLLLYAVVLVLYILPGSLDRYLES
ncbi:MAG: DUF1211 domain-containing protein [Chloroflexi bacterium]|nr:DUF1211 domain-containing protein [Chloroflexota bacterium]